MELLCCHLMFDIMNEDFYCGYAIVMQVYILIYQFYKGGAVEIFNVLIFLNTSFGFVGEYVVRSCLRSDHHCAYLGNDGKE